MYTLFNNGSSTTLVMSSSQRVVVNDELGRMTRETVVIYFNVLSLNFVGNTEESLKELYSGYKGKNLWDFLNMK
jgi:hypothetical protein